MTRAAVVFSVLLLASCASAVQESTDVTDPLPTGSPSATLETATASAPPIVAPPQTLIGPFEFITARIGWIVVEYAAGPRLLRTNDAGDSWLEGRLPIRWTAQILFADADTGWILGQLDDPTGCAGPSCATAVFKTADGGRSWSTSLSRPAFSLIGQMTAVDEQHAWLVEAAPACRTSFDDCREGLWATVDGDTWNEIATLGQVTSFVFTNPTVGWVATHTSDTATIQKTVDGGHTWIPQLVAAGHQPSFEITFANVDDGWALQTDLGSCGGGGCAGYTLFATHDGGTTWHAIEGQDDDAWWQGAPRRPGFLGSPRLISANAGWMRIDTGAGAGAGGVIRTIDGGRTWSRSYGDADLWSVLSLKVVDADTAFAIVHLHEGTESSVRLVRTTNGAKTWQRLSLGSRAPPTFPVSLPTGCHIISATPRADSVEWRIDCGAARNAEARATLAVPLDGDDWRRCGSGLAIAMWSKGATVLTIAEGSGVAGEGFVVGLRSGRC